MKMKMSSSDTQNQRKELVTTCDGKLFHSINQQVYLIKLVGSIKLPDQHNHYHHRHHGFAQVRWSKIPPVLLVFLLIFLSHLLLPTTTAITTQAINVPPPAVFATATTTTANSYKTNSSSQTISPLLINRQVANQPNSLFIDQISHFLQSAILQQQQQNKLTQPDYNNRTTAHLSAVASDRRQQVNDAPANNNQNNLQVRKRTLLSSSETNADAGSTTSSNATTQQRITSHLSSGNLIPNLSRFTQQRQKANLNSSTSASLKPPSPVPSPVPVIQSVTSSIGSSQVLTQVRHKWRLMEHSVGVRLRAYAAELKQILEETATVTNQLAAHGEQTGISGNCRSALFQVIEGLGEQKLWSTQMVDASAHLPSGLLEGTLTELGNFDECLAISHSSPGATNSIRGQYCSVLIKPHLLQRPRLHTVCQRGPPLISGSSSSTNQSSTWPRLLSSHNHQFYYAGLRLGFCAPNKCSLADLQFLLNNYLAKYELIGQVKSCQQQQSTSSLNNNNHNAEQTSSPSEQTTQQGNNNFNLDLVQQCILSAFLVLLMITLVATLLEQTLDMNKILKQEEDSSNNHEKSSSHSTLPGQSTGGCQQVNRLLANQHQMDKCNCANDDKLTKRKMNKQPCGSSSKTTTSNLVLVDEDDEEESFQDQDHQLNALNAGSKRWQYQVYRTDSSESNADPDDELHSSSNRLLLLAAASATTSNSSSSSLSPASSMSPQRNPIAEQHIVAAVAIKPRSRSTKTSGTSTGKERRHSLFDPPPNSQDTSLMLFSGSELESSHQRSSSIPFTTINDNQSGYMSNWSAYLPADRKQDHQNENHHQRQHQLMNAAAAAGKKQPKHDPLPNSLMMTMLSSSLASSCEKHSFGDDDDECTEEGGRKRVQHIIRCTGCQKQQVNKGLPVEEQVVAGKGRAGKGREKFGLLQFSLALLVCFSIKKNLCAIGKHAGFSEHVKRKEKQQMGDLKVIHGLRTFTMIWIIFGHTIGLVQPEMMNNLFSLAHLSCSSRFLQALLNATLAVNTFFMISGLVTVISFVRKCQSAQLILQQSFTDSSSSSKNVPNLHHDHDHEHKKHQSSCLSDHLVDESSSIHSNSSSLVSSSLVASSSASSKRPCLPQVKPKSKMNKFSSASGVETTIGKIYMKKKKKENDDVLPTDDELEVDSRKKNQNTFTWPRDFRPLTWILMRYLRLTPAYATIVGFSILLPALGSGPFWLELIESQAKSCRSNWWSNLLYVNNFIETDKLCLIHSWYLSNDWQFFLVTLILFAVFYKSRKLTIALILLAGFATTALTFFITVQNNFPPTIVTTSPAIAERWLFIHSLYYKPWPHFTSYLVGLITGYLILIQNQKQNQKTKTRTHRQQQQTIDLASGSKFFEFEAQVNWRRLSTCLLMSLLALSLLFSIYPWNMGLQVEPLVTGVHSATWRTLWSICCAWLVYVLVVPGGKTPRQSSKGESDQVSSSSTNLLARFLGWHGFQVSSRLTYCAYLVHPLIIYYHFGSLRERLDSSMYGQFHRFMATLGLTYLFALLLAVLVESPSIQLQRFIVSLFHTRPATTPELIDHAPANCGCKRDLDTGSTTCVHCSSSSSLVNGGGGSPVRNKNNHSRKHHQEQQQMTRKSPSGRGYRGQKLSKKIVVITSEDEEEDTATTTTTNTSAAANNSTSGPRNVAISNNRYELNGQDHHHHHLSSSGTHHARELNELNNRNSQPPPHLIAGASEVLLDNNNNACCTDDESQSWSASSSFIRSEQQQQKQENHQQQQRVQASETQGRNLAATMSTPMNISQAGVLLNADILRSSMNERHESRPLPYQSLDNNLNTSNDHNLDHRQDQRGQKQQVQQVNSSGGGGGGSDKTEANHNPTQHVAALDTEFQKRLAQAISRGFRIRSKLANAAAAAASAQESSLLSTPAAQLARRMQSTTGVAGGAQSAATKQQSSNVALNQHRSQQREQPQATTSAVALSSASSSSSSHFSNGRRSRSRAAHQDQVRRGHHQMAPLGTFGQT